MSGTVHNDSGINMLPSRYTPPSNCLECCGHNSRQTILFLHDQDSQCKYVVHYQHKVAVVVMHMVEISLCRCIGGTVGPLCMEAQ